MKQTTTVRLEPELLADLDRLAQDLDRPRSYLIEDALRSYLELHARQVAAISEGLRQADAGELIPHAKVRRRWASRAR